MKLALVTYTQDDREALLEALMSDGASVIYRKEHYGGVTGTSIFGLCDLVQWIDKNPWLLQGIAVNLITAPLMALMKHVVAVAKTKRPEKELPFVAGVVADVELYGMFARAYLAGRENLPLQKIEILSSTVVGHCTAEHAQPYFTQMLDAQGEPLVVFICSSPTKYYAVTIDSSGRLIILAEVGLKPSWMTSSGK